MSSIISGVWFAVPGMYGGFSYGLLADGVEAKIESESWCRVVEGSRRAARDFFSGKPTGYGRFRLATYVKHPIPLLQDTIMAGRQLFAASRLQCSTLHSR